MGISNSGNVLLAVNIMVPKASAIMKKSKLLLIARLND